MKYTIDVSFPTTQQTIKTQLEHIAESCNTRILYDIYDIEFKRRKTERNNCICTIEFETRDLMDLFINKIKPIKNLRVDSIYYDDTSYELLYASKKYQKEMPKGELKEYLNRAKINK